jgi:Skp family chaperone for outer membrane proteins
MARWGMAVAAATLVAGAAFVAGSSSVPQPKAGPTAGTTAAIRGGSRVGYVNLPRIHREYRKAAKRGDELNAARKQAREQVEELKAKYRALQNRHAPTPDQRQKEQFAKELLALTRQIEESNAAAVRDTTAQAEASLRELFADIREAVKAVAKEHGLDAVHAYPGDPDTDKPAEMEYILKTPALAPLYLNPDTDLTDRVLKRLNDKFDGDDK